MLEERDELERQVKQAAEERKAAQQLRSRVAELEQQCQVLSEEAATKLFAQAKANLAAEKLRQKELEVQQKEQRIGACSARLVGCLSVTRRVAALHRGAVELPGARVGAVVRVHRHAGCRHAAQAGRADQYALTQLAMLFAAWVG